MSGVARPRLGVDIGGTTVKARLAAGDTVLGEWRVPTPCEDPGADRTVAAVVGIVAAAGAVAAPSAVAVVAPGIVDEAAGVCRFSANLGWRDVPLRQLLEDALGRAVTFGHDVRAAAVVEGIRAGVGPDDIMAFIPLGTGVAAAYTRGIDPLPLGPLAGEVGQVVLGAGPRAGFRVEQVCSARGIADRAGQPDAEAVAQLVRAGDVDAARVWDDAVDALGEAIAWITGAIGPRVVVLGGGLSRAGDLLLAPVTAALGARLPPLMRPGLRLAAYGSDAAVVGALRLAGNDDG